MGVDFVFIFGLFSLIFGGYIHIWVQLVFRDISVLRSGEEDSPAYVHLTLVRVYTYTLIHS